MKDSFYRKQEMVKVVRSFMRRNPQVRLRNACPLDKKRAKISADDVDHWFTEYERFVLVNGLSNTQAQIWNCDESRLDLQGKAG